MRSFSQKVSTTLPPQYPNPPIKRNTLLKVGQLVKEDKSGFVKTRKEAAAKKDAEAKTQGVIQEFFATKIQPLMQAREFDKALAEVKTFIKENPDTPEQIKVFYLMNIGVAGPMSAGDSAAAIAVVDDVAKMFPESDLAKNSDKVKASIKERLDSRPKPKDKPEEGKKEEPK